MTRASGWMALFLLGSAASASCQDAAQPSGPRETVLLVRGEVPRPLRLSLEDLQGMPRTTLRVKDRDGKESVFDGVTLGEVLARAGAPLGEELRGLAMLNYVLAEARDGYRVVFSLPELDTAFTDHTVLVADRCDGKPIADPEGPLRLIVPGDHRHARWVRQVAALTLQKATTTRPRAEPQP